MCLRMKYERMNEQMSHELHILIYMSNVFWMHDISVWNVQIMNELMLHDFHF
jgi:hypothetical protein